MDHPKLEIAVYRLRNEGVNLETIEVQRIFRLSGMKYFELSSNVCAYSPCPVEERPPAS
jgi:hypothetical protein